jgi:hypothetical protein
MGGFFNSPPAAVGRGSGKFDIFAVDANNEVMHKWYDAGWHPCLTGPWIPLGGGFNSGPHAVVRNPNRIDLFGLNEKNELVRMSGTHGSWPTTWTRVSPERYNSVPAVIVDGRDSVDAFGVDGRHKNQMLHMTIDDDGFGLLDPWTPMGDYFITT